MIFGSLNMQKSNYAVGKETRKKIWKASRNLFYEKGLNATTYDDISKAAGINRALIPYYFKTKHQLGRGVFQEITEEFYKELDKAIDMAQYSQQLQNNIQSFGYYRLLRNEQYGRFAAQIFMNEVLTDDMTQSENDYIRAYIRQDTNLTEKEIAILSRLDYGIEREIINLIQGNEKQAGIDEICIMELRMLLQYCGYSEEEISELAKKTVEVLNQCRFEVESGFRIRVYK